MMAAAQSGARLLADSLCCLGQGILVACLYDLARVLLGRSRPVLFWLDLLGFGLAGLLLFSYGVSRSWAGSVRGYMILSLAAGCLAYFGAIAPATRALENRLRWLLSRPFALLRWLLWPCAAALCRAGEKEHQRYLAKRKQKYRKRLQKNAKVLYNSNQI